MVLKGMKKLAMRGRYRDRCPRGAFGDYYNCIWEYRKICEIEEICRELPIYWERPQVSDLPRIPVRVEVSVADMCGGSYNVYVETKGGSYPVGLRNFETIPAVLNALARERTEWDWSIQVRELDDEIINLTPEILRQDAILVWTRDDIKVSEEFKKCLEIYYRKYTREELEAMTLPQVRCVARVKKLNYRTGTKTAIINSILLAQET